MSTKRVDGETILLSGLLWAILSLLSMGLIGLSPMMASYQGGQVTRLGAHSGGLQIGFKDNLGASVFDLGLNLEQYTISEHLPSSAKELRDVAVAADIKGEHENIFTTFTDPVLFPSHTTYLSRYGLNTMVPGHYYRVKILDYSVGSGKLLTEQQFSIHSGRLVGLVTSFWQLALLGCLVAIFILAAAMIIIFGLVVYDVYLA